MSLPPNTHTQIHPTMNGNINCFHWYQHISLIKILLTGFRTVDGIWWTEDNSLFIWSQGSHFCPPWIQKGLRATGFGRCNTYHSVLEAQVEQKYWRQSFQDAAPSSWHFISALRIPKLTFVRLCQLKVERAAIALATGVHDMKLDSKLWNDPYGSPAYYTGLLLYDSSSGTKETALDTNPSNRKKKKQRFTLLKKGT